MWLGNICKGIPICFCIEFLWTVPLSHGVNRVESKGAEGLPAASWCVSYSSLTGLSAVSVPYGQSSKRNLLKHNFRPCRSTVASHRGGPGSCTGSMWGLWWTKRHWGKVFSEYFGFPCQAFHRFLHYHNNPGLIQ
jgi:hypothetical protein